MKNINKMVLFLFFYSTLLLSNDNTDPSRLLEDHRNFYEKKVDSLIFHLSKDNGYGKYFRKLLVPAGYLDPYVFYKLNSTKVKNAPNYSISESKERLASFLEMEDKIIKKDFLYTYETVKENGIKVLDDAPQYYSDLFNNIREARKTVDIIQYGFKADKLGLELSEILIEKASQGIPVRVIVDNVGSNVVPFSILEDGARRFFDSDTDRKKFLKNIDLKRGFNRNLEMYRAMEKAGIDISYHTSYSDFSHPNENTSIHLDHRKLIIIDGTIAYVGGRGFEEHFRNYKTEEGVVVPGMYDCMVKITGPVVQNLSHHFVMSWFYENYEIPSKLLAERESFGNYEKNKFLNTIYTNPKSAGKSEVEVLANIPGRDFSPITIKYYELIEEAKPGERLCITNPIYSDDVLTEKLIAAKKRGVNVIVVLPKQAEMAIKQKAMVNEIQKLHKNGIEILLFPLLLHAKILLVGDKVLMGSCNIDWFSFYNNWELNLLIKDKKIADEIFTKYFARDYLDKMLAKINAPLKTELFQGEESFFQPLKIFLMDFFTFRI